MNSFFAIALMAGYLSTASAAQTNPDPAVKTGNGKTAQTKKAAQPDCSGAQGGVDVSGGESVEQHAKADKTKAGNSAACGKHNGKADSPQAAPTTPHPEIKDPVIR
ncbi:hypothetical protein [Duganella callida]|uniref:Homeobox protein YbgS n=1 Tax=Duganella callida TaxID=2561932 RepID=A0A4Y9SH14_9BURK|nr:hypothetical protein [Duganella callida]TFW23731.1 hypothetical protein E4L98_10990 [Duganella callida]